jgi:HupE / UreJ protein
VEIYRSARYPYNKKSSMTGKTLLALWLFAGALTAHAHKASDSQLTLHLDKYKVAGQWDIAIADIEIAVGLDSNQDNVITWGEVKDRAAAIERYALSRLTLGKGGRPCVLHVADTLINRHSDGAYVVLRLRGECAETAGIALVDYRLLFDIDAHHRGLVAVTNDGYLGNGILSRNTPTMKTVVADQSAKKIAETKQSTAPVVSATSLRSFFLDGIKHIAIGTDHLLFLMVLLLPAAVKRQSGQWVAAEDMPQALWRILSLVTAFTISHSITLSLSVWGVVQPPTRLVESLIAISIIVTALDNLWPFLPRQRWLVAFFFGLIHGFGFASVLIDLQLPRDSLFLSLFAFNVGVEAGQIALVALLIPVGYLLRRTIGYSARVIHALSWVCILVATGWFLERAFHLEFMPM